MKPEEIIELAKMKSADDLREWLAAKRASVLRWKIIFRRFAPEKGAKKERI